MFKRYKKTIFRLNLLLFSQDRIAVNFTTNMNLRCE